MGTLKDIAKWLEMIVYELHLIRASKQVPEDAILSKRRKVGRKTSWTEEEDNTLIRMKKMGYKFKEIAVELNRTEGACSARMWVLNHTKIKN